MPGLLAAASGLKVPGSPLSLNSLKLATCLYQRRCGQSGRLSAGARRCGRLGCGRMEPHRVRVRRRRLGDGSEDRSVLLRRRGTRHVRVVAHVRIERGNVGEVGLRARMGGQRSQLGATREVAAGRDERGRSWAREVAAGRERKFGLATCHGFCGIHSLRFTPSCRRHGTNRRFERRRPRRRL